MTDEGNLAQSGSENDEMPDSPTSISSGELLPIPMEDFDNCNVFAYLDQNSVSAISSSILANDLVKLKNLVLQGKSLRIIDNNGDTPLHYAVRSFTTENKDILEYLLSLEDVDLNAENHKGITPLLNCAMLQKETAGLLLVEAGADIHLASNEYVTPLHYAARFSTKLSEALILKGSDINGMDFNGYTPLHEAVFTNSVEAVQMLLYYNVDANVGNSEGRTPFMESLAMGYTILADELFEYVIDFNRADFNNVTTLCLAILCNYSRIKEMIERGADVNDDGNKEWFSFPRFVPMEIDTFRYIWQRFNYNQWLGSKWPHILIFVLNCPLFSDEYKLQAFNIVLNCENEKRMLQLTQESEIYPIILPLVNRLYKMNVSSENIYEYCVILLSYGLIVYDVDLDMVYEHYGYVQLFKLLLHMDIKETNVKKFNIFPRIIYQVRENFNFFEQILESSINTSSYHGLDNIDYHNILDNIVNFHLMKWFETEKLNPMCHMLRNYIKSFPRVPKLQELAIHKMREFVRIKFNITSCGQFYTTLNNMHIPNSLKKLLAFEIPLYTGNIDEFISLKGWLKPWREKFINALENPFYNQIPFPSQIGAFRSYFT